MTNPEMNQIDSALLLLVCEVMFSKLLDEDILEDKRFRADMPGLDLSS